MKPDEKLVYMANQIAKFFAAQGEERAARGVADHLQKFWDPVMRRDFLAAAAKDSSSLHPAVKAALPILQAQQEIK
ncbi:MAG TPA: formate dehydrogenase subunit delta [Rhizomicrobium sp.]|jgi:formate dehydrogenase subunit delta|nr:formate dehydrogenase subunit delta [Rhizomicrobium sp.]